MNIRYFSEDMETLRLRFEERFNILNRDYNLVSSSAKINKLVEKGRLNEHQRNFIFQLYTITNEVVPREYFDIQLSIQPKIEELQQDYGHNATREKTYYEVNGVSVAGFNIILHFPELTIKNSKDKEHLIKDLFVSIPITFMGDRYHISRIMGTRTTISPGEYAAKYCHSHLPSKEYSVANVRCKYYKFCLGSDTDVALNTSLLNSEFDTDLYKLFLYNIYNYVRWESLEGGPHILMSEVYYKNRITPSAVLTTVQKNFFKDTVKQLSLDNLRLHIDWKVENGQYKLIENAKFEANLQQIALMLGLDKELYYKDDTGKLYREDKRPLPNANLSGAPQWLPFKGEKKFFNIDRTLMQLEQEDPNRPMYLNPQIKKYVREKLEYTANISSIREISLRRANTLVHT